MIGVFGGLQSVCLSVSAGGGYRSVFKYLRRTPDPVIVTLRDNEDYIRVLSYSYYITITGWGVLLTNTLEFVQV